MTLIITTYINPDLDGVASAVVAAAYLVTDAEARFTGRSTPEIDGVLGALGLDSFQRSLFDDSTNRAEIMLVDCHHPAQLPSWVDPMAVVRIIDHHPDGVPAAFPNARLQNELVGAAATLIAEAASISSDAGWSIFSRPHAALLACAIASNTLDFAASSTSARDHEAFHELRKVASPGTVDALVRSMAEWRASILANSTWDVVAHDVKKVESKIGVVAVSQVEAAGAVEILSRDDLMSVVARMGVELGSAAALLSLVDTSAEKTYLVSPSEEVRELLMALGAVDHGEALELPFIALRKTHIIPALQRNLLADS